MSKTKILRWTDDEGRNQEFSYNEVKSGSFSKVYIADNDVMIQTEEGCNDKECLMFANQSRSYKNLPVVERLSYDNNLYWMPRYMPITGNKVANKQRRTLQTLWDAVYNNNKYDRLNDFNNAVQSSDLPDMLKESVDMLTGWIANYGSDCYCFEFTPRNLAQDADGNLILLDIFFNHVEMERKRDEARKRTYQRIYGY